MTRRDFNAQFRKEIAASRAHVSTESHVPDLRSLRAANDGGAFLSFGLFRRCLSGGFGGSRTRAASGIQIELAHFVEQGFVTDAEHLRGILTAPIRFLQSVGDGT